jgi:hypothetical protein
MTRRKQYGVRVRSRICNPSRFVPSCAFVCSLLAHGAPSRSLPLQMSSAAESGNPLSPPIVTRQPSITSLRILNEIYRKGREQQQQHKQPTPSLSPTSTHAAPYAPALTLAPPAPALATASPAASPSAITAIRPLSQALDFKAAAPSPSASAPSTSSSSPSSSYTSSSSSTGLDLKDFVYTTPHVTPGSPFTAALEVSLLLPGKIRFNRYSIHNFNLPLFEQWGGIPPTSPTPLTSSSASSSAASATALIADSPAAVIARPPTAAEQALFVQTCAAAGLSTTDATATSSTGRRDGLDGAGAVCNAAWCWLVGYGTKQDQALGMNEWKEEGARSLCLHFQTHMPRFGWKRDDLQMQGTERHLFSCMGLCVQRANCLPKAPKWAQSMRMCCFLFSHSFSSPFISPVRSASVLCGCCSANNLAVCTAAGLGVPKDVSRAFVMLQALVQAHPSTATVAMVNLGMCYQVPKCTQL